MERAEGCVKCGMKETTVKNVSMAGSGLSKIFDIEHNNFVAISCNNCGYTEFYKDKGNSTANIIDLFFS